MQKQPECTPQCSTAKCLRVPSSLVAVVLICANQILRKSLYIGIGDLAECSVAVVRMEHTVALPPQRFNSTFVGMGQNLGVFLREVWTADIACTVCGVVEKD